MMVPDRDEAERFLSALDPNTDRFTFQTFDDNQDRKDKNLARILHGTLAKHFDELVKLNELGAGIFVTVNITDLKGRTISNIIGIRAVFVDLDGAPVDPVLVETVPKPHIITETSAGRWHAYWRVHDMPLAEFSALQQGLIARFDGDKAVHDLPRVMRIPGFIHRKGDPFFSRLVQIEDIPPHDWSELAQIFKLPETPPSRHLPPLRDDRDDMPEQWRRLNSEALANLSAWVPNLFPNAKRYHEGYRVSSKNLHRNFEEDLSIRTQGICDFAVHDMGDPNQGRRTPIDLVMEHHRTDFVGAVRMLANALGRDPKEYEPGRRKSNGADEAHAFGKLDQPLPAPIAPYIHTPFDKIPPRHWLHAKHYVCGHVVMTVAPGGYGKSSLLLCNAIEMATGKGLIGPPPLEPLKVCYWNAEESDPWEVQRRIAALCLRYNIDAERELVGRLFLGQKITTDEWRFAVVGRNGALIENTRLIKLVTEYVGDNHIACVMLDPMVEFHRLPEIDTILMQAFLKRITEPIAAKTNSCFEYSHHTRKPMAGPNGAEITADDSRGAGAAAAAARSVRVINRMSKDEARNAPKSCGITDDNRRLYLRVARDKMNMAPPAAARWVRLISINIGNAHPPNPGDQVQAIEAWSYPGLFDNVTTEDMHFIRAEVAKHKHYRADQRAKDWIGFPLIEHFGLDPDDSADRRRVAGLVKVWMDNGVLAVERRQDARREMREFVIPGKWRDEAADYVEPSLFGET